MHGLLFNIKFYWYNQQHLLSKQKLCSQYHKMEMFLKSRKQQYYKTIKFNFLTLLTEIFNLK